MQNPKASQIRENIVDLQGEYQALSDIWQRRDKELHQDLDLLVWNIMYFRKYRSYYYCCHLLWYRFVL